MMNEYRHILFRPQPAWVIFLVSMVFILLALSLWNLGQTANAAEEQADPSVVSGTGSHPTTLNYQGYVTNASGQSLNGNHNFQFKLYLTSSGGTAVWTESYTNVSVGNGFFNVLLGSKTNGGIPHTLWQSQLYLETILNQQILSPREAIHLSTASMALSVPDGSVTSDKLAPVLERIDASHEVILTPEFQSIVVADIYVPRSSRALVIATCDCRTVNGALAIGELWINGQKADESQIISGAYPVGNNNNGIRHVVSNTYVVDLAAGNNQIEVKVRLADGSGYGIAYSIHSGITYMVVSQ